MVSGGEQPSATLSRASSLLVGQEETNARRTEILILAIGVLFLVSQLILIVWSVLLPIAVARRQAAQRDIAWAAIPTVQKRSEGSHHRTSHGRGLRRNSTWNGRSTALNLRGEYLRQRPGPDSPDTLDLSSSQCISNAESESESDGSGPKDRWERGLTEAAVAALDRPLSPIHTRSPLSSPETEMESQASDPGRIWTEPGSMAGSSGLAGRLSPRSPRLQPLDQATIISAILRTPGEPSGTKAGPPTAFSKARPDDSSQAESYDDWLGVKCRVMALLQDRADTGVLNIEEARERKRRQDSC